MTRIVKITEADRQDYITMARDFYSGPGVLHSVKDDIIIRTFDEIVRSDEYLAGYMFKDEKEENLGYAVLSFSFSPEVGGKSIFIEEIYVRPEYRGKGIGHLFLDYTDSLLTGEVRRLRLEAVDTNEGAISLYERYGFKRLDYMQMTKDI